MTISHLDSGLVVASLKVDSDTRYYGNARFGDGWLYLVESPTLDRLDQTGPSLVHALDLETFTWSLVNPPSGTHWTQWPGTLLGDGSAHGTYGWVVDEEGRGCVAQIIATAAELGSCVADSVVMTSHSDSGLSALTVPPGGTVGDCRTRVTLAGLHAEPEVIGPECRTFDGLRHGDWEIWSEIPPDAHGRVELWRANLFASRSGETIELSTIMTTGTLTLCGDAVFWYERANEGPDGTIDSLVRWKPGEPSTVAVLVSEQDQALGALTCTNGLLSTFVISELGHGLTSVLVDPRVP